MADLPQRMRLHRFHQRFEHVAACTCGFLQVAQLKEVYGFPDSTYQVLKNRFIVDSSKVKKLNVNMATEAELAQHPYIGKQMARNIIILRNGLQSFENIEQLRQVPLINEEKYRKIAPYLVLN